MSLQVEKLEKNMAKLTIEVSADEFSKALEDAYQKNKSKISVPGFRKGKVPKKMIEQMYGKGVFYEDAANALIPEAYEKALEEVLPVAFSIVKDTARRFTENEEIVVTATDFDRTLAATKDFVRIEGDKAIYQNHWNAGGNDTIWNMI